MPIEKSHNSQFGKCWGTRSDLALVPDALAVLQCGHTCIVTWSNTLLNEARRDINSMHLHEESMFSCGYIRYIYFMCNCRIKVWIVVVLIDQYPKLTHFLSWISNTSVMKMTLQYTIHVIWTYRISMESLHSPLLSASCASALVTMSSNFMFCSSLLINW